MGVATEKMDVVTKNAITEPPFQFAGSATYIYVHLIRNGVQPRVGVQNADCDRPVVGDSDSAALLLCMAGIARHLHHHLQHYFEEMKVIKV